MILAASFWTVSNFALGLGFQAVRMTEAQSTTGRTACTWNAFSTLCPTPMCLLVITFMTDSLSFVWSSRYLISFLNVSVWLIHTPRYQKTDSFQSHPLDTELCNFYSKPQSHGLGFCCQNLSACPGTLLRHKVQTALGSSQVVSITGDDCQIICMRNNLAPFCKLYVEDAGHQTVKKSRTEDLTLLHSIFYWHVL